MERHVRILAIIHIVSGGLWLLLAFLVATIFGGVAGLIGFAGLGDPDAAVAAPIVALVGMFVTVAITIFSIPSIVAGIGLLNRRNWARILTIVLSVLLLVKFPIGTAIGVYGLWVLLANESLPLFDPARPRPAGA
jgi:hypothetical protein